MNLETFYQELYVVIDEWYKTRILPEQAPRRGRPPRVSDSEVLTLAVVSQWRVNVPWQSERGFVRYMQKYGLSWFPQMLKRSGYNARVRQLYGVLVQLQQAVGEWLTQAEDVYECLDCYPLPAFSNGQALREAQHWLWASQKGHGGNWGGWYWGDKLLVCVRSNGAVTGWLLGSANVNDRWLAEALLSTRTGALRLQPPPVKPRKARAERPSPPLEQLGPQSAVGRWTGRPYLADQGFNGRGWQQHWQQDYRAEVITVPPTRTPYAWTRPWRLWLAHYRQVIETTLSLLDRVFGLGQLQAHSRWGQYTRIAAKMAACNLLLWFNRRLGQNPFAWADFFL